MTDGKIEVLGEKQVMLPFSAVMSLQNSASFDAVSIEMKKVMGSYGKKMGSSSGGMVKCVQDIYETTGLGKMEIIKLDADKKETVLRLVNISFTDTTLVEGVLCGLFSFLFNKDLERKNITVTKKATFVDIAIK
ncbi:hypothetical protein EXS74_01260 [Candidatus Woesearchaeota archaeon]|nr:hypothetical protein [Candidatus Woesearchaeota archaeon]